MEFMDTKDFRNSNGFRNPWNSRNSKKMGFLGTMDFQGLGSRSATLVPKAKRPPTE